jgi:hypothetical protein
MYTGENGAEVLESMPKRNFFHSDIPDAKHWWSLGIASEREMRVVQYALPPVSQKILKAHLVGVEDHPGDENTWHCCSCVQWRTVPSANTQCPEERS